jgi:hypothetical protein
VRGAVRLAASDEKMAPYCNNTVDALISQHPRAVYPPQYTTNDDVKPLQQQESDIAATIKSFPAGLSCGLDGLLPQPLKDTVGAQTAAAGQQLLTRLTDFTHTVLSGHVPKVVRPVFLRCIILRAEQERWRNSTNRCRLHPPSSRRQCGL